MEKLMLIVGVLNFVVTWLLLMAVDRLSGLTCALWKKIVASGACGIYAALCVSGEDLARPVLRWSLLVALGLFLYLGSRKTVPRLVLMLLLNFSVEGFQLLTDQNRLFSFAVAGLAIAMVCVLSFRGGEHGRYFAVELVLGERKVELTALADTGNTLRDPVTGESVLIISHKAAYQLTGLTRQQLANPVETLEQGVLPGLRLIPYHSIGCEGSMLLAMRIRNAKLSGKERALLVAFAPAGLGKEGTFEALAGGMV